MKRTGIFKALLLLLLAVPTFLLPIPHQPDFNLAVCLGAFLLGGLTMPFVTRYNLFLFDQGYTEPEWNDNPLARNRPMALFQFFAWLLLTQGVAMIVGAAIQYHFTSAFGTVLLSMGFGLLLGVYLIARRRRNSSF